jgi:hypothetical protein
VGRRPAALALVPPSWEGNDAWSSVGGLGTLKRADGGGAVERSTLVRLCADDEALWIRFDSASEAPAATLTGRDQPLWTEDVVEVFLAPGAETPGVYYEFEVNPLGALFDARVVNPNSRREDMKVETAWDCGGISWGALIERDRGVWSARLRIPWSSLSKGPRPRTWRANFFRIERSSGGEPEFSAWSPTFAEPPDFHKPEFFGALLLDAE